MADMRAIADAVKAGRAKIVKTMVNDAVAENISAETIMNEGLVTGMLELGEMFKNNEVYVPEVLIAARAMKAGMEIIKPLLLADNVEMLGTVAIGTVKGDLHDIGKNLVAMMLEGAGFNVIDLGVDVTPEQYVECVKNNNVQVVGMSALLTTTMTSMKEIIDALKDAGLRDQVKVIIGGAPITQEYADEIGADGFSVDAASATELAKKLLGK